MESPDTFDVETVTLLLEMQLRAILKERGEAATSAGAAAEPPGDGKKEKPTFTPAAAQLSAEYLRIFVTGGAATRNGPAGLLLN